MTAPAARSAVGGLATAAPLVGLALVVVAGGTTSVRDKVVLVTLNVLLAVGLQMFSGTTGVLSFAPLSFAAVGAYTGGILAMQPAARGRLTGLPDAVAGLPPQPLGLCLLVGAAAAGLLGLLTAAVPLRTAGTAAVVTTLALLLAGNAVLIGATDLTRGAGGLAPVPELTSLPVALAVTAGVIVVARMFRDSRTGVQLRAAADDPVAAAASGVAFGRLRLRAWLASAVVHGAAGALLAMHLTSVSPTTFYLSATFGLVAMLIVGGRATVSGAALGAVLVSAVQLGLRSAEDTAVDLGPVHLDRLTGLTQVATVVVFLLVMYLRPAGIAGQRELDEQLVRRLRR